MKFSKTSKFIHLSWHKAVYNGTLFLLLVCCNFSSILLAVPRVSRWPIVISSTEISVSTEVLNSFVHCLGSVVRISLINLHVAVHLQCSFFFEAFSLFLRFQSWSLQTNNSLIRKWENLHIFCLITKCCMSLSPDIQNSGNIGGGGRVHRKK